MFAEIVSIIFTGLFAGAALYVSLVEHPARMANTLEVALAEFRPSYKRAAVMQVILAVIGVAGAIGAYFLGRGISTLVAGIGARHSSAVYADRDHADQPATARRDQNGADG